MFAEIISDSKEVVRDLFSVLFETNEFLDLTVSTKGDVYELKVATGRGPST